MTETRYSGLAGRVVLITGGASGIGAAFVRAFASQKARVAFLDIDALRAAMTKVHASLGDAAVLVNNAANDQRQVLADVTSAEFD